MYEELGRDEKSMKSWVGTKNVVFCSSYDAHTLFSEIYKRGLWPTGSVTLSKHITLYGPWSGFPYYNLKTHHREGSPYHPPGDVLNSSVGLSPSWEPSPVPET